jgi:hypothetical protein
MPDGVATLEQRVAPGEEERFLYGVIAEFEHADEVVAAANKVREAGYRRIDAYSPFPVEGLSEALGQRQVDVPWIMLAFGALGGVGMFAFMHWATYQDYAINVGGRPNSILNWPYFIPITFELTVLSAAIAGIVGMFWLNGLPQPYHPVFDAPNFEMATSSRFFLCIEAEDPNFDHPKTKAFMETLGALRVSDVELRK